jgi:acyl-CoA dehydrogenase
MGIADGSTELHKQQLAKQIFQGIEPAPDLFPSQHGPRLDAVARDKYAAVLAEVGAGRSPEVAG